MTDLREKLAEVICENRAVDNTFALPCDYDLADAIIAALPGMVKPLEWRRDTARTMLGAYVCMVDGAKWSVCLRNFLIDEGTSESFEAAGYKAKAAANAHYRATIMAALGVEGE